MVTYVQMAMVMVFGMMLVAAIRLRNNGKNLSVSMVVDHVQKTFTAPVVMTMEQHRTIKKARYDRRRIGWAERRLITFYTCCKFRTKQMAFRHLSKMVKSADHNNVDRVETIFKQLAMGKGDTRFQAKAMHLLKQINPRQALKLQVSLAKTSQLGDRLKQSLMPVAKAA
ncbi:MAG TPA: hypothetical protein ENN28_01425 [Candidatus Uhrbacteria bacterium]|nr:hypothetical protein [Candidatus Uhrbacteria bacterium]